MIYEFLTEVIVQTVLITFFVLSMIMVLEYVNVRTRGHVNSFMHRNSSVQILTATIFGLLPGCIGSYTAVSLYTHDVIGLGALIANLIATTGDEAFMMLSLMPQKAFLIFGILAVLSIIVGYSINIFDKLRGHKCGLENHLVLHRAHDEGRELALHSNLTENLKHLSRHRLILILSIIVFIVLTLCGFFNEEDNQGIINIISTTFVLLSLLSLWVVLIVPNHFLEEHIWHHVIDKHFTKVLFWSFFTLTIIFVLNNVFDIESWVKSYSKSSVFAMSLIAAIVIGLIPESGPHIIFISLYCSGIINFGVLMANCIVQDGHGAIPLFAESKRDFFIVKGVKVILAIIVGTLTFWLE